MAVVEVGSLGVVADTFKVRSLATYIALCDGQKKMSGTKARQPSLDPTARETTVKELINKYNTNKSGAAPKLRRFGRRKNAGRKRRGSKFLAVPTQVTKKDPEVANSKSAKEQEILLKLEQQQQEFQRMLEEQRREKAELEARLVEASGTCFAVDLLFFACFPSLPSPLPSPLPPPNG